MNTYKLRAYIALSMLAIIVIIFCGNSMGLVTDGVRNYTVNSCFCISLVSLIFLQYIDNNENK